MKTVAKYNLFKGISTFLTIGSPIVTLLLNNALFVQRSDTAMSFAAIIGILIAALFAKDKLAENLKVPSAFVVSTVLFVLILVVEKVVEPVKYVCLITMITSGVDEITFKRFYKAIELQFPEGASAYKICGFMATTTDKISKIEATEKKAEG